MGTKDHWFLHLQLSKVDFDSLIMQLDFFWKSLVFPDFSYLKLILHRIIHKFIHD